MDINYTSIREAANQTGYGVEYIRRLIREGQIRANKISTRFYMVCVPDLIEHKSKVESRTQSK